MKILFAVSLTEPPEAVQHVEKLAGQLDAELYVMHVTSAGAPVLSTLDTGEFDPGVFAEAEHDDHAEEGFTFDSRAAFDRFVDQRFTRPVKTMLRESPDVAATIVRDLERLDADILVLGQKPHPFLERLVLGSVSQKVLKSVKVPTLLIPLSS